MTDDTDSDDTTEITGDPTELSPDDLDSTPPDDPFEYGSATFDNNTGAYTGDTGSFTHHPRDGAKLVVALVDYNDTDATGRPTSIQSEHEFSLYELAKLDDRDFAEHVLELASRRVLAEFRSDDE